MTKKLCIYHGKCADGFTAAWIIRKFLGADNVEFHIGVYQDPPPDVTGRDVIMADFSYKKLVIEQMAKSAHSILILDHHATAKDDLSGFLTAPDWEAWRVAGLDADLSQNCRVAVRFDMERSGAGLTWDYLLNAPRPALVNYVEDRDLWRFKLEGSREVNAYVFAHEYDFAVWDDMAKVLSDPNGLQQAIYAGAAIELKHHKDVAELVGVCKRRMKIGGVEVWGASLPYTLTSDAGHLMAADGEPFAACYWDTPEGRVFSLRSRDDGADVSLVAKQYGGGGHPHASGFRVPFDQLAQFEL